MTLNFQKAEKAASFIWTVKTILLGRGLVRPGAPRFTRPTDALCRSCRAPPDLASGRRRGCRSPPLFLYASSFSWLLAVPLSLDSGHSGASSEGRTRYTSGYFRSLTHCFFVISVLIITSCQFRGPFFALWREVEVFGFAPRRTAHEDQPLGFQPTQTVTNITFGMGQGLD